MHPFLNKLVRNARLGVEELAMSVIVAVMILFAGLFMIVKFTNIINITNTSDFYTTYTNLITNTGTIFEVLIAVLVIVAIGYAIIYLRGFGRTAPAGTASPATI